MACKVISVYCDVSNPGGCTITYNDCFGNVGATPAIPNGGTILLDGTTYPCAEDGTVVSTNGTIITTARISDCDPNPTLTPTETPTPTPTPTGLYDTYQFQDCCGGGLFQIENVPAGTLNEGEIWNIDTVGFSGCATVIAYSSSGPVYSGGIFIGPYGGCDDCNGGICPSPTPTPTETQTPTPTPTNTETPTPTPTITPTNTVTPSITPTNTVTPSITPTATPIVCYSGVTNNDNLDGSWEYYDCCGDLQIGSGVGIEVCVNSLLPYNGVTISPTFCSISCSAAAEFIKCGVGTIFYGLVDSDTAFVGATYLYNNECYSFVQFGGPGGPDLGTPDFGDCITCLNTPVTPTQTSTPVTPTLTPTITSTPSNCPDSQFCLNTTLPTLSGYSGNYNSTSLFYNSRLYYSGDGVTYGVIYYTGDRWCLSSSLGGTCLLEGASPCYSICPDISANLFTTGSCISPTPAPTNCNNFDFVAYFDCDLPNTPTITPTISQTPTVTPTPTITPTRVCNTGVSFNICRVASLSPTPTPTPTITPTNLCDVQGQVSFVMLDETFTCTSVKVLVDCNETNIKYYVIDDLIYEGIPIETGTTISAIINGTNVCVTYQKDETNISSNAVASQVTQIFINCDYCTPPLSPSQTPTQTSTPTPTITPTISTTPTNTPTPGLSPSQTPTNTPTPTSTPIVLYSFSACCDGTTFNLDLGDLTPIVGDTYYFTNDSGLNSFSGCASVITYSSTYPVRTVNTAQSYDNCDECIAENPCPCDCQSITINAVEGPNNYYYTDCLGNEVSSNIETPFSSRQRCADINKPYFGITINMTPNPLCQCNNELSYVYRACGTTPQPVVVQTVQNIMQTNVGGTFVVGSTCWEYLGEFQTQTDPTLITGVQFGDIITTYSGDYFELTINPLDYVDCATCLTTPHCWKFIVLNQTPGDDIIITNNNDCSGSPTTTIVPSGRTVCINSSTNIPNISAAWANIISPPSISPTIDINYLVTYDINGTCP